MAFFPECLLSSYDLLIRTPVIGYGPSLIQYDLIITIYIYYFQISLYSEVLGRHEFGGCALFSSVQNICFKGVSFYLVGLFVYICAKITLFDYCDFMVRVRVFTYGRMSAQLSLSLFFKRFLAFLCSSGTMELLFGIFS